MMNKAAFFLALTLTACLPTDGVSPDDLIEVDGGSIARGCIQRKPSPDGGVCIVGDHRPMPVLVFNGELGTCAAGDDQDGMPALHWYTCDRVQP